MRILKVSQTYYPYMNEGGRPVKVRALAERLARQGHQVVVLTANLGDNFGFRISGCAFRNTQSEKDAVEVVYLHTWARHRTVTLNPEILSFCRRRLRDFDIVHIYGLYDLLGPVAAWFCRRWAIPYVVEPMGMMRPVVRSIRKKRLYHRLFGRRMIRGAARIIATSDQEWRELIEEGLPPEVIVVRRNGIELEEFASLPPRGAFRQQLGLSDDELLVLYLGRLSRKKGLDLLLQAVAGLVKEKWGKGMQLVIVGPDDRDGCVKELERLRRQLHLEDRVTILGPRFGREKLEAFVDADVFVLPSHSENFGNAVAEAIACGVPVIVTDRCGIAPIVKDRVGLVVKFGEEESWRKVERRREMERVKALRAALERMLTDHDLRARFRANCDRVRQELSWEDAIAVQERIYAEVMKGNGTQMNTDER